MSLTVDKKIVVWDFLPWPQIFPPVVSQMEYVCLYAEPSCLSDSQWKAGVAVYLIPDEHTIAGSVQEQQKYVWGVED
jgi:hypothetical protein